MPFIALIHFPNFHFEYQSQNFLLRAFQTDTKCLNSGLQFTLSVLQGMRWNVKMPDKIHFLCGLISLSALATYFWPSIPLPTFSFTAFWARNSVKSAGNSTSPFAERFAPLNSESKERRITLCLVSHYSMVSHCDQKNKCSLCWESKQSPFHAIHHKVKQYSENHELRPFLVNLKNSAKYLTWQHKSGS